MAAVQVLGCADDGDVDRVARVGQPLAHPGPWSIPAETLAIGDAQYVPYTGAGPWVGEEGCAPGILPGTDIVRDYLYAHFPAAYSIGGYDCRPIVGNSSLMSVHGTGRAIDVMIHTSDGAADNDLGDPVGNWLIENAQAIGIQYIIWDLYSWRADRPVGEKGKDYGGAHPHHDHLHIELGVEAAQHTTNWFEDLVEPPLLAGCATIPSEGATIEEVDGCVGVFGPAQYWRFEEGGGHGGSLLWTDAFESSDPSNWARWNLVFEQSGTYAVEIYVDPDWGLNDRTRYRVRHAGGDEILEINQGSQQGWALLGEFEFSADEEQFVDVFDDVPGPVASDQHIVVDALRVTGETPTDGGDEPPDEPPQEPEDGQDDPSSGASSAAGLTGHNGCNAGRSQPGSEWAWLALAVGVAARRRRRA